MANDYQGRKDASQRSISDPEGNMVFVLEVEGVEIAHFIECSGLKSSTQVFEIEEGGNNQYVHRLPGRSRWENIQLRFGVTSDTTLLSWRDEVLQDEFRGRRNGAILLKNVSNEVIRRYNFKNAWPVSWEGPAFNANGKELAIETLEIAHHGIEISVP
jgi:phage tail-like protein